MPPLEKEIAIRNKVDAFLKDQVIDKTHLKINALREAVSLRPNGKQSVHNTNRAPKLSEIQDFKNIVFRFEGDHPYMQSRMAVEMDVFRDKYPEFSFESMYGYNGGN